MLRKIEIALAVLALLATVAGCRRIELKAIPHELVGVWRTAAPKYANRSFEFTQDLVYIDTGQVDRSVYGVMTVNEERGWKENAYTIRYISSGGEKFELSILYDPKNGGEVRFKSQPDILWTRDKPKK